MASYLNQLALTKARRLIDARQYVLRGNGGAVEPSADDQTAAEWRRKEVELAAHELLQHLEEKRA